MDTEEIFQKLKPILGKRLDTLWIEYQLNPKQRSEIDGVLRLLAAKHLGLGRTSGQIFVEPPPLNQVQGEYKLGTVLYGAKEFGSFGLRDDEWIQHMGIFGRTGSGKTNVGFLIAKALAAKNVPILVFDWKRNYRDLLAVDGFKDMQILTVGRQIAPFAFNPLMPPSGTEPEIFLKKLIEIMMHVYWLGDGVAYLLQKAIDDVYRQQGVYSNTYKDFPTLFDIRDWLLAYKVRGREAQWMDSTRRVIQTLCFGQIGNVVNAKSNASFEKLLKSNAIPELDALGDSDKTFLIESLLLWLHHKRMREPDRERLKHAIVIEEAHHVLLKRTESKETVMDVILREIREFGESIIFLDQHPSLVSIPALGNSYCTIAMNLKHGNDVSALGRAMLLKDEDKESLGKLPVGEAIVKIQGRWTKPFHVRFPEFQIQKGKITDADLRRRNPGDSAKNAVIPMFPLTKKEILPIPSADKELNRTGTSEGEARFLEDVMAFPIAGLNERIVRAGFSTRGVYSVISSLLEKGLISSASVSTLRGKKRIMPPPQNLWAVQRPVRT